MNLEEFLKNNSATSSKTFGEFIKANREERGLSVRAFAIELDISAVYLSDIERGARPASTKMISILKNKLGITPDEEQAFYDMASLTHETVAPEIIRYLIENPEARQALRKAIKKNLTGRDLLELVENRRDDFEVSNT